MKFLLNLIFLIFTCLLFYSNIYNNEFVFDDPDIIVNNKAVHDLTDLKAILTTNYWHDKANAGLYRPLIFLTYAIDYFLWGKNPAGYHIINIISHILVCLVFSAILRQFKIRPVAVFIAAVVFAVHPVHTEAVTGIVGRAEVIASLFFCFAWLFFIKGYENAGSKTRSLKISDKYLLASVICYFLSLCSKENSVVFPLIIIVTVLYLEPETSLKKMGKLVIPLIPYCLVFLVYMVIRWKVIGSIGPAGTEQYFYGMSSYHVFLTMLRVFARYLRLLMFPTDLICVYRHWDLSTTIYDWRVLLSMGVVLIWLWSALLFFKEKKLWQFFNLSIFICLLPVSNIIRIGDIMAERFLYLPSAGYCAAFAIVSVKLFEICGEKPITANIKRFFLIYFFIVVIFFGFLTLKRNSQWRNGIVFWKTTIKDISYSYSAYYNLAYSYWEKGYKKKAAQVLRKSLRHKPDHAETRKFLAFIYNELEDYDQAIYQYLILLKTNPHIEDAYSNLALIYMKKKMYDKAVYYCNEGFANVDKKSVIYHALIRIYLNQNDIPKAIDAAQKLIGYDPKDIKGYIRLGDCYDRLKELDKSQYYYIKALSIDNKNLEVLDKTASLFFRRQNYDKALKYWDRAIKLYPGEKYIWYYIGLCQENLGLINDALNSWRKISDTESYAGKVKEKFKRYNVKY